MRFRYLLYMVSIAIFHMVAFGSFMTITGNFTNIVIALPLNLGVLVVMNAVGAYAIFAPIQNYLSGEQPLNHALTRIHRLPVMSACWGAFLVAGLVAFAFFVVGAICPECDSATMLPFYLSMITLFATFVGIYLYFAIGDYTAQLKAYIFQRHGDLIEAKGSRLRNKFIAAFVAVGVAPMALAFLEAFAFAEARVAQGITSGQAFLFDFIIIVLIAGASFYFIQRNLSRPIDSLIDSMRLFGQGNLDTKTPILTDDEIGLLADGFNEMVDGVREQNLLRETFGKYVPESVAAALIANKGEFQPQHRLATILYTDIQGFTNICETLEPEAVVALLNEYYSLIVPIIERHQGVVNQFQGDALLVTFNVPVADPHHAEDAVRAAMEIQEALADHEFSNDIEMITRIGVNTGEVVAGAVGAGDRLSYTVHGDAVNLAARLENLNKSLGTRLLISEFTAKLVDDTFIFEAMGEAPIRGRASPVQLYSVRSGDTVAPKLAAPASPSADE